jgi:hypothetical protein
MLMAAFELRNQKGSPVASSSKAASSAHFPLSMDACSRVIRSIAAVASSASLFDQSTDTIFEFHEAEGADSEVLDSPDQLSVNSTRFKLHASSPHRSFRLHPSFQFIDNTFRPNSGILPFRFALNFKYVVHYSCNTVAASAILSRPRFLRLMLP